MSPDACPSSLGAVMAATKPLRMADGNPWSLTEREAEVLAALAEHGAGKVVAQRMGVSHKTIEQHVRDAKLRMGLEHRTQAIVAWDRWKRREAA